MRPGDLSSATTATRRANYNREGRPPFAAAHGQAKKWSHLKHLIATNGR
jgi:hypothetical protein